MSVLGLDLLTQSSDYTVEPVRGLDVVWCFPSMWVFLKVEKKGIGSMLFLELLIFFFSLYITVFTVLK